MKLKEKIIVIGLIVFFFVVGLIIFIFGIQNGENIAVELSKPVGATSWSTSEMQMKSVSYGICIFGGLWILVSHILFILFIAQNYIFKTSRNS